jgi:translation initiation factor IF-3
VRQVRLIDEAGAQVGVVETRDALRMAKEREYDLVLIAPNSVPPVARLLDYGKWRYEQQQADKEARKKAKRTELKSIKLRPKIETHDYGVKSGHVKRFLQEGHKVKITIMFRGREMAHPELGTKLLERMAKDMEGIGFVEMRPEMLGRDMNMVMSPGNKPSPQTATPAPSTAPAAAPSPASTPESSTPAPSPASTPEPSITPSE